MVIEEILSAVSIKAPTLLLAIGIFILFALNIGDNAVPQSTAANHPALQ